VQGLIDKADEILSAGRNEEEVLVEDAPFWDCPKLTKSATWGGGWI
jgi:hypothetical protein